ncbi:MAG: hypothetical protein AAGJ70_04400 [Pseudomonadota bacterium]
MSDVLGVEGGADRDVIRDSDVLEMRRTFYNDGAINQFEAEKLIERAHASVGETNAWDMFFIEAITDFVVEQMTPRGYVTEAQAQWLIDALCVEGQITSGLDLEVLLKVIENAIDVPESLCEFTLVQIGEAVLDGDGALLGDEKLTPGVVGAPEVQLLSRVLYAAGGANNIGVSRAEAEVLFDINDATRDADNAPEWSDLFVKAVANHVMASQGYKAPSREEALRLAEWRDTPSTGVGGFLSSMLGSELSTIRKIYAEKSDAERDAERLAMQIRDIEGAEILDDNEGRWLADRIGRDGVLHDNEKALLEFIRVEAPEISAELAGLMANV